MNKESHTETESEVRVSCPTLDRDVSQEDDVASIFTTKIRRTFSTDRGSSVEQVIY